MGKWTPAYYDDVLHHKIRTLVTASIRRTSLEKPQTEPTISYESFVESLDTGDSFTATLIDTLVKELADRKARTPATDAEMHLISERTNSNLHKLTDHMYTQVYRRRRRLHPEPSESSIPPITTDMEDFDSFMDRHLEPIEGVTHDMLYDALRPTLGDAHWSSPWRPSSPDPLDTLDEPPIIPSHESRPVPLPLSNARPSSQSLSSTRPRSSHPYHTVHPGLSRQPSIRRQSRRSVDFSDFTAARRSVARERETTSPDRPYGSEGSETGDLVTRRFFHLGRSLRRRRSSDVVPGFDASHSGIWFSPLTPQSRQSSEDRDTERPPRLRRGGLRAPETLAAADGSQSPANAREVSAGSQERADDEGR
ncbi:hypothetical protein CYLTODRAFT_484977 [Cylindrobasidium torrendii FP15055 ss-10]|uniref:Uncharacterized protein n=1 Tax=Cylindrobasidium torrendii FP15055 ss-10 TaxID=1314674 RepID=A0A0D7BUB2_9AGAR|nr:hypothetical protein CYLTODRAFT_484977 [Cylindrobasidium torrendii FP15055 ss-10]